MVDSSSLWPVSLHPSSLEVLVSRHEQEMVIHQLLTDGLIHTSQWKVLSRKITLKLAEGILHQTLHLKSLLLGDSRAQSKSLDASSDTNSGALDWDIILNVATDLASIHVTGVGGVSGDSMVFLDDRVKNLGEILLKVAISSIDTTMLIVELNSAGNSLGQSEPGGGSLDAAELVPLLLGHMLSNERMLRLDGWEFGHCSKVESLL